MKNSYDLTSLIFPDWYDDLAQFEHEHKGYLNDVIVKLSNGKEFSLNFIDQPRLQQNLEDNIQEGLHYYTEKNLIIVKQVTKEHILKAVDGLIKQSLFKNSFVPNT